MLQGACCMLHVAGFKELELVMCQEPCNRQPATFFYFEPLINLNLFLDTPTS
jgi:hypothetical protein